MSVAGFEAAWPAPPNVRTWQTLRTGGVSTGAWQSLNLGLHVGDDPVAVDVNRRLLSESLQLPEAPAWLEQVHGNRVVDLDGPWAGAADAAVTGRPGAVAVVLTADCLPVLLCDRAGTRAGAAHGGWRGLAAGVLPAVVAAMRRDPHDLVAWLGPAIGPGAYEVGDEVRAACLQADPEAVAAFTGNSRGRWQADLYALARSSLAAAGVTAVFGGGQCTYADTERYFSHRRESPCGRMATLIWLEAALSFPAPSPSNS